MKRVLAAFLLASVLAACTTIEKVDGEQVVGGKLAVTLPQAWNKVTDPWERGRYDMWTQEGIPLDHLRLWAGLRPGESLVARPTVRFRAPGEKDPRYPRFAAGLRPHRLVHLFEQLYANEGVVQVTRIEPVLFAGEKGVRFEFTLARRADDLVLQGVGWAAEHRGALYAATFVAPRLALFRRLLPMAEAVVRSARIKG